MTTDRSASFLAPLPAATLQDLLLGLEPDAADALLRECLAEAAMRRQLQRIHDSHYGSESPHPREWFRVA